MKARIPNPGNGIHVVTTSDRGSMDRYGRDLARRLPVPELVVCTGGASMDTFGAPWLSRTSLRGLLHDVGVVRTLRSGPGIAHLTHHHMARYGPLTRRPFILTVHDIIRWFDLTGRDVLISKPNSRDAMGLRRDYEAFSRAVAIIAVSQLTKNDLVE